MIQQQDNNLFQITDCCFYSLVLVNVNVFLKGITFRTDSFDFFPFAVILTVIINI